MVNRLLRLASQVWSDRSPQTALLLFLLGAILVLRLATVRPGHDWGDDFAQYIAHAENIAHGHAYADIGYIYDRENSDPGPRAYPPGFPLLLAPVVAVCGEDLLPMKLLMNLLLVAALAVGYALFRGELPDHQRLLWAGIVGFSPVWLQFGNMITSDVQFTLFFLLALLAERRAADDGPARSHRDLRAAALGAAIFAAVATRSIGIVLLPALWLSECAAQRRITRRLIIATTAAAGLIALQMWAASGGASYLDQLTRLPQNLWLNLRNYPPFLKELFAVDRAPAIVTGFVIVLVAAAFAGFVARAWERRSMWEATVVLYAAVILLWPNFQGLRFLLPVFPLFVFYLLRGIGLAARLRSAPRAERALTAIVAMLLAAVFAHSYAVADYGPIRGVTDADAQRLFAWVRDETDPAAVIVFQKPRALALYAHRRAAAFPPSADDGQLLGFFCRIGARYVVRGEQVWPEDRERERALAGLIDRNPSFFEETRRFDRFTVYQLVGCPSMAERL